MSSITKQKKIAAQHAEDRKYLLEKGWTCLDSNTPEVWSRPLPDDAEKEIVRTFRQAYKAQVRFDIAESDE